MHNLFIYFLIAAVLVFIAVIGFITYILLNYRKKANDEDGEPPQIHGDKKVEVGLTLLATAMIGFFFYLTISTMLKVNKPAGKHQADLVITAHQWWWGAKYPKSGASTANEIHIPAGKKVLLKFTSADVIHDWWIPGLGRKMDIFPNRTTHLWLKVNKPGLYLGACSEYCGAQHAWMRIRLIVQKPDEFKKWQSRHVKKAISSTGSIYTDSSMAGMGKKLFMNKTCAGCHTIRGTRANGKIGPELTHLATRKTLLTGKIKNTPRNLYRWIHDPQKVKEGAHMPRFILKKKQIQAIVSYLEGLR